MNDKPTLPPSISNILFEGASKRWPRLTIQQFDQAGSMVLAQLQARATIAEISSRLDQTLTELYGPGQS